MRLRWFLDLAFVKNTCVGKVSQLPAGPDPVAKGSVQKQAPWKAVGMMSDWCDTDLGSAHDSKETAMLAIAEWYGKLIAHKNKQMKKACSAHFSYSPGCVMCEAINTEEKLK